MRPLGANKDPLAAPIVRLEQVSQHYGNTQA